MGVAVIPLFVRYIEQQQQQWVTNQRSVSPNQGGSTNDHHLVKHGKSPQKSPQDSLSNSLEALPSTTPNLASTVSVVTHHNQFTMQC